MDCDLGITMFSLGATGITLMNTSAPCQLPEGPYRVIWVLITCQKAIRFPFELERQNLLSCCKPPDSASDTMQFVTECWCSVPTFLCHPCITGDLGSQWVACSCHGILSLSGLGLSRVEPCQGRWVALAQREQ